MIRIARYDGKNKEVVKLIASKAEEIQLLLYHILSFLDNRSRSLVWC
jgi:hypothetical protein